MASSLTKSALICAMAAAVHEAAAFSVGPSPSLVRPALRSSTCSSSLSLSMIAANDAQVSRREVSFGRFVPSFEIEPHIIVKQVVEVMPNWHYLFSRNLSLPTGKQW